MIKCNSLNSKALSLYSDMVSTMYDKRVFDLSSLCRKISPFVKTDTASNTNMFYLRSRNGGGGVSCTYWHYQDETHIRVNCSDLHREKFIFDFYVTSNKDFLQKLLKHNLLN